jgi:enolase
MPTISRLKAGEILDSRGKPTVKAACTLASGVMASASVPSGASTGKAEAVELRDGDPSRYRGLGCRKAVANVDSVIAPALVGVELPTQAALDAMLLQLDGTPNKSNLGANATLAVSIAFARACAAERGIPLYAHLADVASLPAPRTLPRMTINLFSGGKHAGGQVAIQDILLVPRAATIDAGLADTWAVFQEAVALTQRQYGARPLRADEGGLAPPFPSVDAALADAEESIIGAGLAGNVALAIDVASSHFFRDGTYYVGRETAGRDALDAAGMIRLLRTWAGNHPIVSIEDGLSEDDWAHWPQLRAAIGGRALVLGDDFLCTNPQRIRRAIDAGAADALLL